MNSRSFLQPAHHFLLLLLVVFVVPLAGLACSSSDQKAPTLGGAASLVVTADSNKLPADGTEATLSITAQQGSGEPGTGSVAVQATLGSVNGGGSTAEVALTAGRAELTYSCDAGSAPACVGSQSVTVTWAGISKTVVFQFEAVQADAGDEAGDAAVDDAGDAAVDDAGDANSDAQDSAPEDAGLDSSVDAPEDVGVDSTLDSADGGDQEAEASTAALTLTAIDSPMFSEVGDHAVIRARLLDAPDGGPLQGQEIEFSTNVGLLEPVNGPPPAPAVTMTATTDGAGIAEVWLIDNGAAGTATVTATHAASGDTAQVNVQILTVQQITHVSTTCSGQPCTIMGIKGSGFNEQAQITFAVVDSSSNPAPGVKVAFSIANPPAGTTVTPEALTNAQGRVTANVSAGPVIGAFTVSAVVIPGMVQAESPTIGIRGAKPANRGFSLHCSPVNVGAYVSPTPPKAYSVNCDVKLVDRYNNPVGTGTSVNFKTEAGSIPNSIATEKYVPTGTNANEGTGTVTFSTIGTWPAWDVDPLPADLAQEPVQRDAEPSITAGSTTYNPRDGLVTILAYVRGEEFFQDDNNNGTRDQGEQFVDQGEPFVDANDNGVRDQGEVYIDEAPADGQWNPPNGKWDNDTSIWVEARVLYTGLPGAQSHLVPNPFGTVPRGGDTFVDAYFPDQNLNRVQAAQTSFSVTHTATKGSVSWASAALLDDYGFGIERILLDAATGQVCSSTSAICRWRMQFYNWDVGYCGHAKVTGAYASDTTPSQDDTLRVESTVLSNKLTIEAAGTIQ